MWALGKFIETPKIAVWFPKPFFSISKRNFEALPVVQFQNGQRIWTQRRKYFRKHKIRTIKIENSIYSGHLGPATPCNGRFNRRFRALPVLRFQNGQRIWNQRDKSFKMRYGPTIFDNFLIFGLFGVNFRTFFH